MSNYLVFACDNLYVHIVKKDYMIIAIETDCFHVTSSD